MSTFQPKQRELGIVNGVPLPEMPEDLFIPPQALEICLETFTGPMDLLLYLIKKQNINILDLEVSKITDQYIDYINLMDSLNFELAAEYLVMAATLAEIKSRMLLPKVEEQDDETDPRLDLIRRLQEYQVFKTVSEELANMDRVNRDFYLASVGMPKVEKKTNVIDFNAARLKSSMVEVLSRPKLDKSHQIAFEELSTQDRIKLILSILSKKNLIGFYKTLQKSEGKIGVVVSFLASLELAKDGCVDLIQNNNEEIYIKSKVLNALNE